MLVLFFAAILASFLEAQTPPPPPVRPAGSPCELGTSPAATLLVPYFEVDPADPDGPDTLVGVTNTGGEPVVVHAVVWNVDAWAVFSFNIYLVPHDLVTFSMRKVLVDGQMPNNACASANHRFRTGPIDCDGDGRYFDDAWTAGGPLFADGGVPTDIACYPVPSAAVLADRQCKLSIGSYDGWNTNLVGYLTLDTVVTCTGALPDAVPGHYFSLWTLDTDDDGRPDHGVLENTNVLMGDIVYLHPARERAEGVPAVHIEAWGEGNALEGHAWGTRPAEWADQGISTFYYKYEYQAGLLPNDAREPLPTVWAFRYLGNMAFDGETWVDVWRSGHPDFEHHVLPNGPCKWETKGLAFTTLYNPFEERYGYGYLQEMTCFDEEGNAQSGNGPPPPPPPWTGIDLLYLASQQSYMSASEGWPLVDESGWCVISFATDAEFHGPGYGHSFDQAWVNVRYSALFHQSTVGLGANAVTGGCAVKHNDRNHAWKLVPTH